MNKKSRNIFIIVFLAPTIILLLLFKVYPIYKSIEITFYEWSGVTSDRTFIGFKQYMQIFTDKALWRSIKHTLTIMLIVPGITISISLLFATLITRFNFKEKKIYKNLFYIPGIISIVVCSIIWRFVYNPTNGLLNSALDVLGLDMLKHNWLGESGIALIAVAVMWIWKSIGYYMIYYIASIEGIDPALYESAKIDGANEWKQFKYITFPLIWNIVEITSVLFIINVFNNNFAIINVMTAGGPAGSTETTSFYMYQTAFGYSNFGYAATIGMVNVIIVYLLHSISKWITSKRSGNYLAN